MLHGTTELCLLLLMAFNNLWNPLPQYIKQVKGHLLLVQKSARLALNTINYQYKDYCLTLHSCIVEPPLYQQTPKT